MLKFCKYILVLFLIFGFQQKNVSGFISLQVIEKIFEVAGHIMTAKDVNEFAQNIFSPDKEVTDSLNTIITTTNHINQNVEDIKIMVDHLTTLAERSNVTKLESIIQPHIEIIDTQYSTFLTYTKEKKNAVIINWAESVLDYKSSKSILSELTAINDKFEEYITKLIEYINYASTKDQNCVKSGQSPQLFIAFKYYENIIRELRGLQMIKYATIILSGTKNTTDLQDFVKSAHKNLKERTSTLFQNMKKRISGLPRAFFRCGPVDHSANSVDEIRAFQRFIISSRHFNNYFRSCPKPDVVIVDEFKDLDHRHIKKTEKCPGGKISNCENMGEYVEACPNRDHHSNSRYKYIYHHVQDYLFFNKKVVYGVDGKCDGPLVDFGFFEDEERPIPSIVLANIPRHPICMCTCSERISFDGYINVLPLVTDYKNNKVMTGVRIVNINGMHSFQIQEGVILPGGGIDEQSVKWLEVDAHQKERIGLKRHKIYLDNFDIVYGDAVLTGIKFDTVDDDAIAISLHYAEFDVSSNKVKYLGDQIGWQNHSYIKDRKELSIEKELPRPTGYGHWRNVDSKLSKQFVKLTTTNIEKDMGQTTIPYLDIQKVEPTPHAPLSGAGFYHKKVPGDTTGSGYLGVMLYTKDLELYL